jgi:transposase
MRTGSPWRDLPSEFGKWYTAYTRFHRWTRKGVWPRVLAALAQDNASEFSLEGSEIRWTPLRGIVARETAAGGASSKERAVA